jgi:hypothetical protein
MFFAALAEIHRGPCSVIITAIKAGSIQDRRPLVLSSKHARERERERERVDPEKTRARAADLARPKDEFTGPEVSKDVGDVRSQEVHLIHRTAISSRPNEHCLLDLVCDPWKGS